MMKQIRFNKKRVFFTMCALLLVFSMSFGIVYANIPVLSTWTSTDHDDFPINLSPIVHSNSIRFLPSSSSLPAESPNLIQPQEIMEQFLPTNINTSNCHVDSEMLEVGLEASLKNEFVTEYPCTLTIFHGEEVIINESFNDDETISLERLDYKEKYRIQVSIENSNQYIEYYGNFYYGLDAGNEVVLSLEYGKIESPKISTYSVTSKTEVESNDTMSVADTVSWGNSMIGYISSSSDVDWFKSVDNDDSFRVIDLIMCNKSSNTTLRYQLYYGDTLLGTWFVGSNDSKYSTVYIPDYLSGTYYMKVSDYSGNASYSPYLVNMNIRATKTWYSQYEPIVDGINYWNIEKIDQLTLSNCSYGSSFVDNDYFSNNVMDYGCGLAATAMMIRNRGVTFSNITDYRCGSVGSAYADPFTVFLVNNNLNGSEINTTNNTLSNYVTPSMNFSAISAALPNQSLGWAGTSTVANWSTSQKETELRNALANHIGGVVICLSYGGKTHFITVTEYVSSGSTVNDRFKVCDPGTCYTARGANVLYSASASYGKYYDITNYTSMYYVVG